MGLAKCIEKSQIKIWNLQFAQNSMEHVSFEKSYMINIKNMYHRIYVFG
jgi:hypothetical protein